MHKAKTEIVEKVNHKIDFKLKKFIENIERLGEERSAISEEVSEIYKEARTLGFDTKTMKRVIKLRKMELDERTEMQSLLGTYCEALGMPLQMGFSF